MGKEQFRIKGSDFAFARHGERIASMKKDGNSSDPRDRDPSGILVQFWDAGNGELMSSRLLEVNDAFDAQFSPDRYFLAIQKRSQDVLGLWNLEDSKDFRRFTHPRGYLLFCFSSNGHFLVIKKEFENVIELWNLEDSKDFQQFTHPDGESESLLFSNQ